MPAGCTQCEKIFACNHADQIISSGILGRGGGAGKESSGRLLGNLLTEPAVGNGGKRSEGLTLLCGLGGERKGI